MKRFGPKVFVLLAVVFLASLCLAQTITVTSPNGGESVAVGQPYSLQWTHTGSLNPNIAIQLYKGGLFNSTIIASAAVGAGSSGSYLWNVPAGLTLGTDYKIRVQASYLDINDVNHIIFDLSDNNFSVVNTSVQVTSPNGGELWRAGSNQTVNWSFAGTPGTDLKVELLQGGVSVYTFANAAPIGTSGTGALNVTVPTTADSITYGSNFSVRITSNQSPTVSDSSNAAFTIDDVYSLTVNQSGTQGGAGTVAVTSTGTGSITNCSGTCTANFGPSGATLTLTATPSTVGGTHTFTGWGGACASFGTNPVCSLTNNSNQSTTANFTGPTPSIIVTAPNGGESLNTGAQSIAWNYTGVSSTIGSTVKIELLKGGVVNSTIATAAPIGSNGSGSFAWTIPTTQAFGLDYQIRVTTNTSIADTSNANFRINGPGIIVTSPNGGEFVLPGSVGNHIAWMYNGAVGSFVKLELFQNATLVQTITTSTAIGTNGVGSYSAWTAPAGVNANNYKIKVTSTSSTTYTDQSDNFFNIVPTAITVTSPNGGELWHAGAAQNITWSFAGTPGTSVAIDLLQNGTFAQNLATAVPIGSSGAGSFSLNAPNLSGSGYAVRVTSEQNNSFTDVSNAGFTIGDLYRFSVTQSGTQGGHGSIAVAPQSLNCSVASCQWDLGPTNSQVTFTATPDSTEGGHTFTAWGGLCTGQLTNVCTLTLDPVATPALLTAASVSAQFAGPPPSITVTSPNGGNTLNPGNNAIQWSYTGVPAATVGTAVKVELYKAGVLKQSIIASTPIGTNGAGSYTWNWPSTLPIGLDYTVKVTSTTNTAYTDASNANFRFNGTGIIVLAPNGGEYFQPGNTNRSISWIFGGAIGSTVNIQLLKGTTATPTITTIVSGAAIGTSNAGSYNLWNISGAQATGSDYKVKVIAASSTANNDVSDNYFTITPTSITVTSPNGGELWRPGMQPTVSWSSVGPAGSTVAIDLLQGGVFLQNLASGVPIGSGSGSAQITVPNVSGTNFTIRVTSEQNAAFADVSNATFTIGDLYRFSVTQSGTQGGHGTISAAATTGTPLTNCGNATCTADLGGTGATVTLTATPDSTTVGNHTFAGWGGACAGFVTNPVCTLTANADQSSTAQFTGPNPTITVVSPNGGNTLNPGNNTIQWSYTGVASVVGTSVKIELYKGGVLNSTISSSTSIGANGSGSFVWNVPTTQAIGLDYTIKVTSTTNALATDFSNANFRINGTGIVVIAPNGGELLQPGTIGNQISWIFGGSVGSAVKLELYKSGILNTTISSSTAIGTSNAGSYGSWSIPANQASGTDYTIKVTSTSSASFTDTSNAPFTISPIPQITNITPSTGAQGQTVTINGSAFSTTPANNTVLFNGAAANVLSATSGSLQVRVPSNASSGTVTVATSFGTSNAAPFTVLNLTPAISANTPQAVEANTAQFTMTINGSGFVPNAIASLGSNTLSTSWSSPTQITAVVPASLLITAQTYSLTVTNPAPGGGTSSGVNFIVTAVDSANSTVSAAPNTGVIANGTTTSTVTVTVRDAANAPLSNRAVQISSTGSANTIAPASANTNGSGVATFTIASTKAEVKTISASVILTGGVLYPVTQTATAGFTGDPAAISASLSTATAAPANNVVPNGLTKSFVTVTVLDNNSNQVAGQLVGLTSTGIGNVISANATTDTAGVAVLSIASTVAEVKTLTLTLNPGTTPVVLNSHPTVTFSTPATRYAFVANKGDNTLSGLAYDATLGQYRHNGYYLVGTAPAAVLIDPASKFVYVANGGSNTISAFSIANDGSLTAIAGSPFATGVTPVALATDPAGQYLFVANSTAGTVSAYSINSSTGTLTSLGSANAGIAPAGLVVDATGQFLYVANKTSNAISGYSIGASAALTPLPTSPYTTGTTPVQLASDSGGRFLFAVNNGSGDVTAFTVNSTTGALTSTGTATAGSGATAISTDAFGKFAYVANSSGTVSMFGIDGSDGHLTALGSIAAGSTPSGIAVDPNSTRVVVTNSGSNDLSEYTLDGVTGSLTAVIPTRARVTPAAIAFTSGAAPVTFTPKFAYVGTSGGVVAAFGINGSTGALSPLNNGVTGLGDSRAVGADLRGRFVFVGQFSANTARAYSINPATGALTFINSAATATGPFAVAVDPSTRFMFTANKWSLNVSSFNINPATGALTNIANSGSATRDLTVDPTGRFLFTVNDTSGPSPSGQAFSYSINPQNGALTQNGSAVSVSGAFGLKTDPTGRFLYVVGSGSNVVATFAISPANGSLSFVSNSPAVLGQPRSVDVHPAGKFVFAANTASTALTVTGFTADPASGTVTGTIGSYATGNNSFHVRFDISGRFLYVPNKLGGTVSAFTVDQNSGVLTPTTGVPSISNPHQIALTGAVQ